jgi:hypothetical protein
MGRSLYNIAPWALIWLMVYLWYGAEAVAVAVAVAEHEAVAVGRFLCGIVTNPNPSHRVSVTGH